MGQVTAISWCDHTFNPVRGCSKVSTGCKFCYAEGVAKRNPGVLGTWGPTGTREVASEAYWKQPLLWDKEAKAAGVRRRVFCASLADVFEDRPEWDAPRLRLLELIRTTPNLDWLLLTKRPENIRPLLLRAYQQNIKPGAGDKPYIQDSFYSYELELMLAAWLFWEDAEGPENVWLGTSVEDQEAADTRIQWLLSIPATVHWLSCEPLVGPVDLTKVRVSSDIFQMRAAHTGEVLPEVHHTHASAFDDGENILGGCLDWVIVGGESGNNPGVRPMHPQWARQLRDQCHKAGVAFHFKQWGEHFPISQLTDEGHQALYRPTKNAQHEIAQGMDPAQAVDVFGEECTVRWVTVNYTGSTWDRTTARETLQAQLHDNPPGTTSMLMFRVGKEQAGRTLDGVLHDEVPVPELYTGPLTNWKWEYVPATTNRFVGVAGPAANESAL